MGNVTKIFLQILTSVFTKSDTWVVWGRRCSYPSIFQILHQNISVGYVMTEWDRSVWLIGFAADVSGFCTQNCCIWGYWILQRKGNNWWNIYSEKKYMPDFAFSGFYMLCFVVTLAWLVGIKIAHFRFHVYIESKMCLCVFCFVWSVIGYRKGGITEREKKC